MSNYSGTNSDCFSLPATSLDTFLGSDVRDSRSALPLSVCSLLLRYLLPQLELERYASHRRTTIEKAHKKISSRTDERYCLLHVTGSSVEGFSVPPYRERTPVGAPDEIPGQAGAPFYHASDIDNMTEVRFLPVEVRPTPGRLYIDEARASHVGYVRLVLDNSTDTYGLSFSVRENICRAVNDGGRMVYYLCHEEFRRSLVRRAESNAELADKRVNISGPAVNLEPRHGGQSGLDLIPDIDIVTALPLLGHPPAFHLWLERVSRQDTYWPSRETVEDIRRNARSFVVTTGHASSPDRDLECRLSFSDPERRLAQTVTPVQRKVYILVKLLQKCYLKEPKVVVTYHLKTLMFWLLEESQEQDWTEQTIFKQVLRFLDKLEGSLARQEIPSYFYPSNNLISHASHEHVEMTLATVRRIRDDPLRHLYGIDERVWMGFSTLTSLSSLHRPVLTVIHGDERDIRLKMANSLMQQASQGTMRNILWPLRCADLLRDAYDILREVMFEELSDGTRAEDSAPWSANDWMALATIAVFAALRQEEKWWIRKVTGGYELPNEGDNSCDRDPFVEAVGLLLPARPHAAFMIKMFLAPDRGNRVPLDPQRTKDYSSMVREELQTAMHQANLPARMARVSLQDKTDTQPAGSGVENGQEASAIDLREKTQSQSTSASVKAAPGSTGAVPRIPLGGVRPRGTTQHAQRSETTQPAPDTPRIVPEVVMPLAEAQDAAVAAALPYGGAPAQEPTMERLAGDLHVREIYGWCPTLIVRLHVQILELIGCLLRRCPRLACRCAFWMHALTRRFGGWGPEATPSVPLADARQFLEALPPTSGALLRRPSARAAMLPLSAFVIFTAVLADEPYRRKVAKMKIGDARLAWVFDMELQLGDEEDSDYDDVVWTSVVMKLCIREAMGQQVIDCLREVGLLTGGDKGQRARQALTKYRL